MFNLLNKLKAKYSKGEQLRFVRTVIGESQNIIRRFTDVDEYSLVKIETRETPIPIFQEYALKEAYRHITGDMLGYRMSGIFEAYAALRPFYVPENEQFKDRFYERLDRMFHGTFIKRNYKLFMRMMYDILGDDLKDPQLKFYSVLNSFNDTSDISDTITHNVRNTIEEGIERINTKPINEAFKQWRKMFLTWEDGFLLYRLFENLDRIKDDSGAKGINLNKFELIWVFRNFLFFTRKEYATKLLGIGVPMCHANERNSFAYSLYCDAVLNRIIDAMEEGVNPRPDTDKEYTDLNKAIYLVQTIAMANSKKLYEGLKKQYKPDLEFDDFNRVIYNQRTNDLRSVKDLFERVADRDEVYLTRQLGSFPFILEKEE